MRKEATNMDEQKQIPFRSAHGLLKVDCASKSWNDIQVRYFEKYPGPGKAYADMSSERSTLVVCREQRGGQCEARLALKVPTERNRYDAGFAVWVPANRTVWGYSEKARLVRDVRLVFDPNRLLEIWGRCRWKAPSDAHSNYFMTIGLTCGSFQERHSLPPRTHRREGHEGAGKSSSPGGSLRSFLLGSCQGAITERR